MSSLTSQNDILNLNPTPSNSKTNFNKTDKSKESKNTEVKDTKNQNENDKEDQREDFLNSLLQSIEETNEFLPDHMKISKKEVVNEALNKLQQGTFDENDKISIFESASFMQILSMLDKLKANTTDIKLGNLSSQLTQIVKTEANFNALKQANNLSELLNIAKDLGLNVKNIKVDRLLDLKATFPNLDKANFFKNSIDNVFKEIINNKITHLIKNKEINTNTKLSLTQNKTKENNANSLLSETLKNLDLLTKDKKENTKTNSLDLNENTNIKIKDFKDSLLQNQELKNIKNEIKQEKTQLTSKDIKNEVENKLKENDQELKNIKNEIKQEKTQLTSKDIKNEVEKNIDKNLDSKINDTQKKEQIIKQEETIKNSNFNKNETIKSSQIVNLNQKEFNSIQKDYKQENHKDLKQTNFEQKINLENIDKILKESNKNNNSTFDNNQNKDFNQNSNNQNKEEKTIEKNSEDLNSLIKELSRINHNQTRNSISVKETLQYFSNDLKEAIEQYKAPITKINITLNPSNLGEVEVTLVQRGNNLHINFNSNTNTMNLFIQNQAEFKNSLVNMGFTGLEMNFSDQGKREQNQDQGKNRSGYGFKDTLDGQNESEKVNLELVLAKYF
ncbi:flagellar hook-length control protein FliK [Campylobacter sp. TTU_617]|uniref:flagellar hook-length control protein FliK n=1 Tax=Campylobacter sp. TTU_617 TaxID=2768148 RepID=UPI0019033704|nr:flagellar hook-length control protein FliK [Campylobacter sp. TTU_617]MBK1971268.1 flagellar hook-length control protein FliK [Campylobacter sp. TTU_617]